MNCCIIIILSTILIIIILIILIIIIIYLYISIYPIRSKIHSKDRKSVYTTGDISRRTIVNTAKQLWSEHKYEDHIIPTVTVCLRKSQDERLLFGQRDRSAKRAQYAVLYNIDYSCEITTGKGSP